MAQAVTAGRPGRSRFQREWRDWLLFVALVGPNLALFGLFNYRPLLYNAWLSLHEWDFLSPVMIWVGLDNYVEAFGDPEFHRILLNTMVFTCGAVLVTLSLGLALALLLNQKLVGRNAARSVLFSPYILSGAAVAVIWVYIFDPNYGLIRSLIGPLGLVPPNWLRDPLWAMPAVIIVYIWKNLGYAVVVYLAGLQSVPKDLHEAAQVDGAGPISRFWHVTLPHLSPVLFFLFVTSILSSLQAFDIINVMTKGGPVDATTTLIYQMYQQGFVALSAGRAAAYAVVLFVIMLLLTGLQLRFLERRVHYS